MRNFFKHIYYLIRSWENPRNLNSVLNQQHIQLVHQSNSPQKLRNGRKGSTCGAWIKSCIATHQNARILLVMRCDDGDGGVGLHVAMAQFSLGQQRPNPHLRFVSSAFRPLFSPYSPFEIFRRMRGSIAPSFSLARFAVSFSHSLSLHLLCYIMFAKCSAIYYLF